MGHTWDNNYNRTPEKGQEQITVGSAGIRLEHQLSRQRFSARASVTRYQHDRREFIDATTWSGGADWRGEISDHLSPRLSWARSERLQDQADVEGKDVVTEDKLKAGLVLAPGSHWLFPLSAQRLEQQHSNNSLESLDYIDREIAAGIRYVSNRNSRIGLNLIGGEREYPNQSRARPENIPDRGDLGYDYTTAELEAFWVLSPKTQLESSLAVFNRDGDANDGSGVMALVAGHWKPTAKLDLSTGLQYLEPAIGETSDSPSEVQRIYLDMEWQTTTKLELGTGLSWSRQSFDANAARPSRNERIHRFAPLTVRYQVSDNLEVNLRTTWIERNSPREDRDFEAAILTLGLDLTL